MAQKKKQKLKLKSVKAIKESIQEEKKKSTRKKKKTNKKKHVGTFILMSFIIVGIIVASVFIAFSLYIIFTSPEFTEDKLYFSEASVIEWDDGTEMAKLGKENRVLKNYEDFPQVLVDALVATEDSRFFQHSGFDAARFIMATFGQVLGRSGAGGASTLTMQISKNYFTSLEASGIEGIVRKFTDIYMAVFQIEKRYTKEQIIEMYLNTGWFAGGGSNYTSIDGVEQGSQYFFGKSVSDLSLPEAAMIVGMYNSPVSFSPYDYPEDCNERKNTVLSLMYRHGYISEQEMLDAQSIHVSTLVKPRDNSASNNPYQSLIEFVVNEVEDNTGINLKQTGGYRVRSTFNRGIQDVINNMQNGAAYTFRDELMQVGVAVTSVENGSIKGIGAGRNYVATGLDRSRVRNQPGSTIKPIIDYGPLIEYNNASTGQMFIDVKYGYNNGSYINNWDNGYQGAMILKDALSQSRNITALQAFHQVDPEKIKEFLNNLSIDEENYGNNGILEAFSVGGLPQGLTPIESSAAYGAFARGGYFIEPYCYTSITNIETQETMEYKYEKKRAMSEATAYMITDVLLQATREGVGGSINSNLRSSIASKSGTSNIDSASASALGVSPYATPDHWVNTYNADYVISMWMGYDVLDKDHYFTTPTGSGPRGKISAYLANNILNSGHGFTKPSSVTSVTVEKNLLPMKRASEYTPANMKYSALFKSGTEPSDTSQRFAKLKSPSNGTSSVNENNISLSWSNAESPSALNTGAVRSEFANFYKDFKARYSWSYSVFENAYMNIYEGYNNGNLGTFGYQVYLKDSNGNLTSLGWTQNNSFTYSAPSGGNYEFVIKSAYSIFKSNQSDGLTIKATVETINEPELVGTPRELCVAINGTVNPKLGVKVTYDDTDVTSSASIIASSVDTSSAGIKDITYKITYNGKEIRVQGKVTVADTCPTT